MSLPSLLPGTAGSNRSRNVRAHSTPPQTVAPPPSSSAEVDALRLEPRVEEKDGFFVLKEKFRGGINPQEKVKIEKEPMKLFMENGIEELAKIPIEDLDKSKLTKDDVDVRLKWLGLFHRRKHHCKFLIYFFRDRGFRFFLIVLFEASIRM